MRRKWEPIEWLFQLPRVALKHHSRLKMRHFEWCTLCTMHVAKLSITKFQIANGNLEPRSYKINFIKSFAIMDNSKLDFNNSMWVTKLHGGERNAFSGSIIQWFKLLNECNLTSKGCSRTNGLQWALEP